MPDEIEPQRVPTPEPIITITPQAPDFPADDGAAPAPRSRPLVSVTDTLVAPVKPAKSKPVRFAIAVCIIIAVVGVIVGVRATSVPSRSEATKAWCGTWSDLVDFSTSAKPVGNDISGEDYLAYDNGLTEQQDALLAASPEEIRPALTLLNEYSHAVNDHANALYDEVGADAYADQARAGTDGSDDVFPTGAFKEANAYQKANCPS